MHALHLRPDAQRRSLGRCRFGLDSSLAKGLAAIPGDSPPDGGSSLLGIVVEGFQFEDTQKTLIFPRLLVNANPVYSEV